MADQKISQLTDGGNAQAADEFVVARSGSNFRIDGASVAAAATSVGTLTSLTVSGNITRSGSGTAAGFLNVNNTGNDAYFGVNNSAGTTFAASAYDAVVQASATNAVSLSVAGTGSIVRATSTGAAVTGNLAVDTNTLYVDAANNRVGVGTATPGSILDVQTANAGVGFRLTSTTGTNGVSSRFSNSAGDLFYGIDTSTGGTFGKANAAVIWYSAAQPLVFATSNTEQMRLDASGNLGLGVTPSAWSVLTPAMQMGTAGSFIASQGSTAAIYIGTNAFFDGTNWKYVINGAASRYLQNAGAHSWFNAASGTAGNNISFTQAMTLDASGNLGVGTATPQATGSFTHLDVVGRSTTEGGAVWVSNSTKSCRGILYSTGSFVNVGAVTNHPVIFLVNDNERARITSGGYFKASSNGTYVGSTASYHEFYQSVNERALYLYAVDGLFTSNLLGGQVNASGTGFKFISWLDNSGEKFFVRGDGNVYNTNGTYGTISDERLKQDIADAGSQWDDLKAVRFRKYRFKSDVEKNPDAPHLLGVVAQELEQTSPGLVDETPEYEDREVTDEDGNVTTERVQVGTTKTVKSSILLMKAAVALQEAMARIEALEARLEALEA